MTVKNIYNWGHTLTNFKSKMWNGKSTFQTTSKMIFTNLNLYFVIKLYALINSHFLSKFQTNQQNVLHLFFVLFFSPLYVGWCYWGESSFKSEWGKYESTPARTINCICCSTLIFIVRGKDTYSPFFLYLLRARESGNKWSRNLGDIYYSTVMSHCQVHFL